jgi:hypothetical protein
MGIVPTSDGRIIDCGGDRRTWGCGCPYCIGRDHPLDRIARVGRAQLDTWAAMRAALTAPPVRDICYCGESGRLYAGGYRCDVHTRQAAGMLSQETRDAIGSYARERGAPP